MTTIDDLKAIAAKPKQPTPEPLVNDHLSLACVTIPSLGFYRNVVIRRYIPEPIRVRRGPPSRHGSVRQT